MTRGGGHSVHGRRCKGKVEGAGASERLRGGGAAESGGGATERRGEWRVGGVRGRRRLSSEVAVSSAGDAAG